MKDLYPIIKYNTIRNNLEIYIFKRIKFIRNLNKTINTSLFNIQKSVIKAFITLLLYYIKSIKYKPLIITFTKVFRNYIALSINLVIAVKTFTLSRIFNITWKKSFNNIIKNLITFI